MAKQYDPTWGVPSPAPLPGAPQQRQDSSTAYTDARVSALLAAARGGAASPDALAATEICAGQWGRAFASAELSVDGPAADAVNPNTLELIGRELVRRGEALFVMEFRRGRLVLDPAAWWDVYGGPNPDEWMYQVTTSGPDETETALYSPDRVLHFRYAVQPIQPWRGLSPLAVQSETSALASILETRLKEEIQGPVGKLVALPTTDSVTEADYVTKLAELKGKTLLVPTTQGGWKVGPDGQPPPNNDWRPVRHGAEPPDSMVNLRSETARHVLASCGVPVELVETSDGTGQREGWRRFLFGTIAPVGRKVEQELRDKLDMPAVKLVWDELRASDLAGRARAFQSMVCAGMKVRDAAELSGLMVE